MSSHLLDRCAMTDENVQESSETNVAASDDEVTLRGVSSRFCRRARKLHDAIQDQAAQSGNDDEAGEWGCGGGGVGLGVRSRVIVPLSIVCS